VLVQNPYPMYYYPDNIYEEIVIFKKPGSIEHPYRSMLGRRVELT
jgi:hypothetical protein